MRLGFPWIRNDEWNAAPGYLSTIRLLSRWFVAKTLADGRRRHCFQRPCARRPVSYSSPTPVRGSPRFAFTDIRQADSIRGSPTDRVSRKAGMLKAQELWKSYGSHPAVAGVSFSAAPGEIVGLLGPNGAGKSTMVAMIAGITAPDRGSVSIGGETIDNDASRVKFRIGLVPQDIALYEDLAAIRNLELFGALYGIGGSLLRERCAQPLALVGLSDPARDKPQTFSGGMKRRLNIACALIHDPDLLLLDEPTVGVDPQSRNAIFANIEALRGRGKAIVYTTHYMEEAERLCDRIVIMDHGRVVASGTKESLRRMLPATGMHKAEIEGAIDDEVLAFLAARGLAVRDADSQGSLEDV